MDLVQGNAALQRRARMELSAAQGPILADVADAQGDVDAYMARYSAEQLTYGTIAPDVAQRLLAAGRVQEAYEIIQNAMAREADSPLRRFSSELDEVYEDCLARLGKLDDLKAHLWSTFAQHLSARALRKYLKLLPDFEDIEAEEKALEIVAGHPRLNVALDFLILWPSLDRAAKLVLSRAEKLDGNVYMTLSQAVDALDARHPLAATLLRRAMITDTLNGTKSSRYRHAARHLAEADAAMLWLRWVEKDIAQILWARANRKAWKGICWDHGISRAAANRRHEYGLAVIVWRLNGKTPPRKRSMQYVIQRAR